jgi:hypothetical protein
LVDEVIVLIPYLVDKSIFFGSDASLDHVDLHPFQAMVEEVVTLMQSSTNPTLLLGSDKSSKVVNPMQYLADLAPLSQSDKYFDYVFSISSLVPSEERGFSLSLSTLPPIPRMVSFDWNDLVKPHLPSSTPFKITILFESMLKGFHQCVVCEGSFASVLPSLAWKELGSPKILSSTSELLDFDRIPSECLGIIPYFPITLGGNTF